MKNLLWVGCAAFALVAAGCSKSDETTVKAEGTAAVSEKGVDVDVSFNDRSDFISKMKSQLKDVNGEIEKLGAKIKEGGENMKTEAQPKLDRLKERAKNLDVEIERAEKATAETWDDVKAGSKKAFEEAKAGFNDARDWVERKLETK